MKNGIKCLCLMGLLCSNAYAERLVALTIDDLPFVGSGSGERGFERTAKRFNQIVDTLVEKQVPATGFIIGGAIAKGQWDLLNNFKQHGFGLGNHTYTHISLSHVGADRYIADTDKADQKLSSIMTSPKYFRYPYLDEGKGQDRHKVYDYLTNHQYTIAPVTIDSKDYEFNGRLLRVNWRNRAERLPAIKQSYLSYIERQISKAEKRHDESHPDILLIHSNLINSQALGDVIDLFQKKGYRFITLDEAIARSSSHKNTPTPKIEPPKTEEKTVSRQMKSAYFFKF